MMAIARDERSDRSNWIAGKHMPPAKAAEKYVKSHMKAVNTWLGK